MLGNVENNSGTMRARGAMRKRILHILLDTGSSHNFLSDKLSKLVSGELVAMDPLQVTIADGGQVCGEKMINNFSWTMQGHKFEANVILFPLAGCDLILGMHWLKTLGPIVWDCANLTMEFVLGGKKIKLEACNQPKNQLGGERQQQLKHLQTYCLQIAPWQDKMECYALNLEKETSITEEARLLLDEYLELTHETTDLPPERPGFDHAITLQEGANPVNICPYRYPAMQKTVIEELINDMLQKGVIQTSCLSFASPVVLVKKKDWGWRLCIDYHALNKLTVKNRYPIPLIEDLFDELGGAKLFSKLDLRSGYHQIRVLEKDRCKIAFQTHSGHFEFLVMPFGLSNAPATFQNVMNHIFKEFLLKFVLVFFDDILIYSKGGEEHLQHLKQVFEVLKQHSYVLNRKKCVLGASRIEYLGHFILEEGVSTDPRKIEAVTHWPTPKNIKQIRSFLGMTGYYRRFIKNYGTIAWPLTELLKRGGFKWNPKAEEAFKHLKEALASSPVLALPDLSKPFTIEADASQFGIGAVLMQDQHPIAYISKALSPKNQALSVYDKELLALVHAVGMWHSYLAIRPFVIRTD